MEPKESIVKQWLIRFDQSKKGTSHFIFIDFKQLFAFLQEVIEKVANTGSLNKEFASAFVPKLSDLIQSYLSQNSTNAASGMRNLTLKVFQEICARALPAEQLCKIHGVLLNVVEMDNEDNALLAIQIVKETLLKNPQLNDSVMEHIEKFVYQLFEDFPRRFQKVFAANYSLSNFPFRMQSFDSDAQKVREKVESKDSFKVISEIHIITLMAMGVYSNRVKPRMLNLVPLIVNCLSLMPTKESQEHSKVRFLDFLRAQNKMYFIIGSLLRILANNEVMQLHAQNLVNCSITYLKNCPPDYGHIRRQFLPVLKDMVSSYLDFYLAHLDDLLSYEILVGNQNEWTDLRAEASVIILKISQYTKEKLNEHQREKVVRVVLQMINDVGISVSIQATAILTLNRYIDIISKMPQNTKILMNIVEVLRMKFEFLAKCLPEFFTMKIKQKESEEHDTNKVINQIPSSLANNLLETDTVKDSDLNFYIEIGKKSSSRNIDDMLKETKQIVQKMTALMQSVINTLCGCPGTQKDTNLLQLSKLFRSGISYFVVKMAIHKIYGKNLINEVEDMEKNVRLFLETFIRMDSASFAQIMDKEMAFLCKCITTPIAAEALKKLKITNLKIFDNEFLMKIPQYIKNEAVKVQGKTEAVQLHIGVFAYSLSKHLLDQFENIGGYKANDQSELAIFKYSRYCSLFEYAMEIFNGIEPSEEINSLYLNFIVLCIKYSRKAILFNNYFMALRSVCKAIKERPNTAAKESPIRENLFREFVTLLPGLIPTLLNLRQDCIILSELIIEIIQNLPVAFRNLMEYLPRLVRPLTECISSLRLTGSLATRSLNLLEFWLTRTSEPPEFIDSLHGMVPEFIPSLHKLFNYQSLIYLVHRMLASLGGRSRPYLTEKEASTKFYPDEGLRMQISERMTQKELIVGIDSCLDASFRYLENTSRMKPENIKFIYKLIKAAYYAFMEDSFDTEYITQCYHALLKQNYDEVRNIAEKSAVYYFDSKHSQVRITPLKRDSQRHTMEKLLTEIFYMIAAYYTRDTYTSKLLNFFIFVCDHLVLIGLCRNGYLTLGRVNEINPITYLNVITEFLNESKGVVNPVSKTNQITYVAINAVKRIAITYMKIFSVEPDSILNVQLLELLIRKLCSLCYWKDWTKKEGASLALLELLDILPGIFFAKYELEIIRSLFYGLSTLPKSVTVTAYQSCSECIHKLISICHSEPHFMIVGENVIGPNNGLIDYVIRVAKVTNIGPRIIEEAYIKSFRKIIEQLISGLYAERKFVRKVAKNCLEQISNSEKLRLEQLLNLSSYVYINKSI